MGEQGQWRGAVVGVGVPAVLHAVRDRQCVNGGAGHAGDYNLGVSHPISPRRRRIVTGPWDLLRTGAQGVREAVFIVEQRIPLSLEWDEWDVLATHALASDAEGRAIGTGRLLPAAFDPAAPGTAHIGRMAVLGDARRHGVGGQLLSTLMRSAASQGFDAVLLHAQAHAEAFYARHGFVGEGEPFLEAGIAHLRMRAQLKPN